MWDATITVDELPVTDPFATVYSLEHGFSTGNLLDCL